MSKYKQLRLEGSGYCDWCEVEIPEDELIGIDYEKETDTFHTYLCPDCFVEAGGELR